MPHAIRQLDEVAMTYAKALHQLAEQVGGREKVAEIGEQLADLESSVKANAKLAEMFGSRIISGTDKQASLKRIFSGKVDPLLEKFLMVLSEKGRLGHFRQIATAYAKMYLEQMGRVEVTVFTAQPMNEDQVAQLRTQIHAKLQREPVMISKVEPRMLGGIRLQIGDTLIDASLETRLRKVSQNLVDNGLPAIRAAAETVFVSA